MNDPVIVDVVDWCLSGFSRIEIREMIRDNNHLAKYSNADCDALISQAKSLLEETVSIDTQQTTSIHIGWFEEVYRYFDSIKHTDGTNKALRAKERLLGLAGSSKTVINKKTDININRNIPKYDINKLSSVEKVRLTELSDKCTLTVPVQIAQTAQIPEIVSKAVEAAIK